MVDIDPKTGAPILSKDVGSKPATFEIPPAVTSASTPVMDEKKVESKREESTSLISLADRIAEEKEKLLVRLRASQHKSQHVSENAPIAPEKLDILKRMAAIEQEAGGISNIGMTSEYWDLQKRFRAL